MWTPYTQQTGSITEAIVRLRDHVTQVPDRLNALSETELTKKVPGKWSRKEILGHLIDSALNNLKRFTDVRVSDVQVEPRNDVPFSFQGYDQTALVLVNRYQDLPLSHLLTLWSSLNTQIGFVAESLPPETLTRTVRFEHDEPDPALTLGWLIEDYVAHLEHHLKTLL